MCKRICFERQTDYLVRITQLKVNLRKPSGKEKESHKIKRRPYDLVYTGM